ncbi:MAG TPA: Mrp/NBP35 family ATP-binding protein [Bacteroidales bacterium]|jgi:ATP-binding protein involved in chromosome partitioning|nr:Mrp/NBP35 family ATP-binding protein [Bacteroidales bacterium]
MADFKRVKPDGVEKIIVVASGKGGVGKSMVSANLSVSLARQGFRVALVDADIYGPSIPKMFGIEDARPEVTTFGETEMMFPIEKFGVKIMSIGFFIARNQGLIWRGPMAANAITQLFENTQWGKIDYMIVDFPPGTGDIQLSTVQNLEITGALIVTTPQEIALNDARKAVSMFVHEEMNIPLIGIIENMSWFTPEKHPEEKYYIFGQGGGAILAGEVNAPLIGQIPLVAELGEAAEQGWSIFSLNNKPVIEAFESIVEKLV